MWQKGFKSFETIKRKKVCKFSSSEQCFYDDFFTSGKGKNKKNIYFKKEKKKYTALRL